MTSTFLYASLSSHYTRSTSIYLLPSLPSSVTPSPTPPVLLPHHPSYIKTATNSYYCSSCLRIYDETTAGANGGCCETCVLCPGGCGGVLDAKVWRGGRVGWECRGCKWDSLPGEDDDTIGNDGVAFQSRPEDDISQFPSRLRKILEDIRVKREAQGGGGLLRGVMDGGGILGSRVGGGLEDGDVDGDVDGDGDCNGEVWNIEKLEEAILKKSNQRYLPSERDEDEDDTPVPPYSRLHPPFPPHPRLPVSTRTLPPLPSPLPLIPSLLHRSIPHQSANQPSLLLSPHVEPLRGDSMLGDNGGRWEVFCRRYGCITSGDNGGGAMGPEGDIVAEGPWETAGGRNGRRKFVVVRIRNRMGKSGGVFVRIRPSTSNSNNEEVEEEGGEWSDRILDGSNEGGDWREGKIDISDGDGGDESEEWILIKTHEDALLDGDTASSSASSSSSIRHLCRDQDGGVEEFLRLYRARIIDDGKGGRGPGFLGAAGDEAYWGMFVSHSFPEEEEEGVNIFARISMDIRGLSGWTRLVDGKVENCDGESSEEGRRVMSIDCMVVLDRPDYTRWQDGEEGGGGSRRRGGALVEGCG